MSEKLPGAEYAPIVMTTGGVAQPRQVLSSGADVGVGLAPGESVLLMEDENNWSVARRLSCTDPDDQRAIWRLAALALGNTTEDALQCVLVQVRMPLSDGRTPWVLRCWCGRRLLTVWTHEYTVEAATAALCAHVWGPK